MCNAGALLECIEGEVCVESSDLGDCRHGNDVCELEDEPLGSAIDFQ